MTRTDAAQLVALLAAYWPTPALPEASQRAYADALVDLDRDATYRALLALRDARDFVPSIAAIRKAVLGDPRDALPTLDAIVDAAMTAPFPARSADLVLRELAYRVVRTVGRDRIRFEARTWVQREVRQVAEDLLERVGARVGYGEPVHKVLDLPAPETAEPLRLVGR